MAISRAEAERELLKLLNRALATVPFVRLDKVDEVTEKFKVACALLEENLNEDVDLSAEEDDGADETGVGVLIPRSMPLGDESPDNGSDTEEETDEEKREQEKLQREREEKNREEELKKSQAAIRPVANKADPVRKDYSSPDIKSRGLRGSISEAPSRPSSRATTSTTGQVLTAPKQSSRARTGETDLLGDKDKQSGLSKQASTVGLKGAGSRPGQKSGVLRDALLRSASARNVGGDGDVQVSKERFTKDDGTPRLGARKLRAAAQGAKSPTETGPKGESNTAVLAKDPGSDAEPGANESDPISKKPKGPTAGTTLLPAASAAPSTAISPPSEEKDTRVGKLPADLIPARPKAHSRIEQSLEAPPSPAQFNSHRHLMKIAGKALEHAPMSKLGPITSSEEVISITERAVESPKPGFLRRLDSPLTNHGKLLQHKARLNKLLRRGIRAVPHLKLENYTQMRQGLVSALEFLESSTTTALAKKDPAV